MEKVTIFGDSILRGVLLNPGNKKYYFSKDIDWTYIENKLDIKIENRSKMGCDILKGKKMIEEYILQGGRPDFAVVEYGGNDSDYNWKTVAEAPSRDYKPNTSLEVFGDTLKEIISLLRSTGINPILMSLPPIIADKYFDWISRDGLDKENLLYFLGDVEVIYRRQEIYSNKIIKVAAAEKVPLVDVREMFLKVQDYPQYMCEDGVHPNTAGHKLISDCFIEYFRHTN